MTRFPGNSLLSVHKDMYWGKGHGLGNIKDRNIWAQSQRTNRHTSSGTERRQLSQGAKKQSIFLEKPIFFNLPCTWVCVSSKLSPGVMSPSWQPCSLFLGLSFALTRLNTGELSTRCLPPFLFFLPLSMITSRNHLYEDRRLPPVAHPP